MQKILSVIYKAVCHFSIAFSGIILFFWSFMGESSYINYDKLTVFAIFAVIFGLSSIVFVVPKLPEIFKTALHFVVNTVGFVVTFASVEGTTQARAFVAGAFFIVIYVVIYALIAVVKKLTAKKDTRDTDDEKKEESICTSSDD